MATDEPSIAICATPIPRFSNTPGWLLRHDNSKIVIRKHESIQLPNLLMRNDNLPDCLKECTRNSSAPPVNGVVLNFD